MTDLDISPPVYSFPRTRGNRLSVSETEGARRRARRRAVTLRRRSTPAESALWARLRKRQVAGARFRRQHPIGPFITDFACLALNLVIEVDGEIHRDADRQAYDRRRQKEPERRGWTVLRIRNVDIFRSPDGVLRTIAEAVETAECAIDTPHRGAPIDPAWGRATSPVRGGSTRTVGKGKLQ